MKSFKQLLAECKELLGTEETVTPTRFNTRQLSEAVKAEKKPDPDQWIMHYIDRASTQHVGGAVVVKATDKDLARIEFKKKKDLKNAPNGATLKRIAGPFDQDRLKIELKQIHKSKLNEEVE